MPFWNQPSKESERIAIALENIALLLQTHLASQGIFIALKGQELTEEGEGEVLLTDPEKIAEIEARKDKYEHEVGIRPEDISRIGPVGPGGEEWAPIEELEEPEGAFGSSSEGIGSVGPEGAESDQETFEGSRGEGQPPTGHIPR